MILPIVIVSERSCRACYTALEMEGVREFNRLYKQLNPEQKKAVDEIEGPVMVVAGPGTGKTQVLTLRIANILRKTDTAPESILALTFTESGVVSMRKKLVGIMGARAYKVRIHTFHGFCNEIIKAFPEEFPRIIGSEHIGEVEQIAFMEEVIAEAKLEHLRPYGAKFYYVRPALKAIRELKREDIDVGEYKERMRKRAERFYATPDLRYESGWYAGEMKGKYKTEEKKLKRQEELAALYDAYQKRLEKEKRYDYEDMIMEVVRALEERADFRLRLMEEYQYILADEHQDANNGQNKLLELLSSFHESPNVFIVGDEKQAIFRFQGASLENFAYFRRKFPDVARVELRENYRSTQSILDSAGSMIGHAEGSGAQHATSLRSQGQFPEQKIKVCALSSEDAELGFIAKDIQQKLAEKIEPDEIAILYRDNKDAEAIAEALEHAGVPYVIESDQNVLADPDIRHLAALLSAVADIGDEAKLSKVLFTGFLGISPLDAYKLLRYRARHRLHLLECLKNRKHLKTAHVEDMRGIETLGKNMLRWSSAAHNSSLPHCFEHIVRESGFLEYLLKNEYSAEKIARLDRFFDEARDVAGAMRGASLGTFIEHLQKLESYRIPVMRRTGERTEGRVRLMTAHKSKGLEFEYVYIIGAYDTHWGNKRELTGIEVPVGGDADTTAHRAIDDERRLFYVALTRAKREVAISYAARGSAGRERLPAQFLEEIAPEYREHIDTAAFEKSFTRRYRAPEKSPKSPGVSVRDKKYLRDAFLEEGLSVTALNNYLRCPWEYFFVNLLRIPGMPTRQQLYGTAMHRALFFLFDGIRKGKKPGVKKVLGMFESALRALPLGEHDYRDLLKKGNKALEGYMEWYKNDMNSNVLLEYAVRGVPVRFPVSKKEEKEITLRGVIDKIETLPEGGVNVVDYKTAKPKSKADIEGKTKTGSGDFLRQLVFYKLLIEGMEKSQFSVQTGEIDFVEPDNRGRYKKETFEITESMAEELRTLIAQTATDIYTFSFWNQKCTDTSCQYCKLREVLMSDK